MPVRLPVQNRPNADLALTVHRVCPKLYRNRGAKHVRDFRTANESVTGGTRGQETRERRTSLDHSHLQVWSEDEGAGHLRGQDIQVRAVR